MPSSESDRGTDRERLLARVGALELVRRTRKGNVIYPLIAGVTVLGSAVGRDFPGLSAGIVGLISAASGVRWWFGRGFETRYERIGERALHEFTALTMLLAIPFGVAGAAIILHYGAARESVLALLFLAGCSASGTSTLAPSRRIHSIFLACIQIPAFLAILVRGGLEESLFLFAYGFFTVFMVREGSDAAQKFRQILNQKLDLEEALEEVNVLREILPICAECKKIRDDDGFWEQVESYLTLRMGIAFSHSLCPECLEEFYPEEETG